MFERFAPAASMVLESADEESDRLRHDYLGPEHILAGLTRQEDCPAAAVLRDAGLRPEAARAGLDSLVAAGVLPRPWRNKADLLRSLGIDLGAVRRAAEESFGPDALCSASRRARSRSWLRHETIVSCGPVNPLAGKVLLAKRAFYFAVQEADRLRTHEVGVEHILLGILRDARDPAGAGLSRAARRSRAYLGLPGGGPSAVRLLIEEAGASIESMRAQVMAGLHAAA